jgi:glutamate/tyrosine decarboxylase-like PLP-dependent enzyme
LHDPLAEIAAIADRHNLWLHVDAAYGRPAAILEEHRHMLKGIERADSIVIKPHKWLFNRSISASCIPVVRKSCGVRWRWILLVSAHRTALSAR